MVRPPDDVESLATPVARQMCERSQRIGQWKREMNRVFDRGKRAKDKIITQVWHVDAPNEGKDSGESARFTRPSCRFAADDPKRFAIHSWHTQQLQLDFCFVGRRRNRFREGAQ